MLAKAVTQQRTFSSAVEKNQATNPSHLRCVVKRFPHIINSIHVDEFKHTVFKVPQLNLPPLNEQERSVPDIPLCTKTRLAAGRSGYELFN